MVLKKSAGLVQRRDPLNFVFQAQEHTHALVQFGGLDVHDALLSVGGDTPGLLDQPGHRVGLVHQSQLA